MKKIIIAIVLFIISGTIMPYLTEKPIAKGIYFIVYRVSNIGRKTVDNNTGIPGVDYGVVRNNYIGKQANPVTVSFYALDYYKRFKKTKNIKYKNLFLNCSDWLIANTVSYGSYSLLEYKFIFPYYNCVPPWRSAMSNGLAVSVLSKASLLTGDSKYLDIARLLLNALFIDIKEGGLTNKDIYKGGWWYEEYVCKNPKSPRVLNGHMHVLVSVYDYYVDTKDNKAKFIFDKGVEALRRSLPEYDRDGFMSYDIFGKPSSIFYHEVCIALLRSLYDLTGIKEFKDYHDRWSFCKYSVFLHLITNPTKIGFLILFINFFILLLLAWMTFFIYEKVKSFRT